MFSADDHGRRADLPARIWFLPFFAMAVASCGSLPSHGCRQDEQALVSDTLYFGMAMPGGIVSDEDWTRFLDDTVTPRFPQGLTVSKAVGQWRSAAGSIVREPSRVLALVHPDDAADRQALAQIVAAYKSRFRQEAVLQVRAPACVSF